MIAKGEYIKISVVVTAYNHENYIAQCLDGILQQKGDFTLEVILGDDCSQDKTRQIMHTYQEKHPDIFMLLPPRANMGITKNIKRCLDACTGSYIAFCEADDYWTDTYKLQKQLEFMESHPEYSLSNPDAVYLSRKDSGLTACSNFAPVLALLCPGTGATAKGQIGQRSLPASR